MMTVNTEHNADGSTRRSGLSSPGAGYHFLGRQRLADRGMSQPAPSRLKVLNGRVHAHSLVGHRMEPFPTLWRTAPFSRLVDLNHHDYFGSAHQELEDRPSTSDWMRKRFRLPAPIRPCVLWTAVMEPRHDRNFLGHTLGCDDADLVSERTRIRYCCQHRELCAC